MAQRRLLITSLVLFVVAVAGTFVFVPFFPQDPAYHHFADTRSYLGIANFWNVVSNLPFLIVGLLSLATSRRNAAEVVFGIGLVLTAIGSSIYHLNPGDATLLYDRAGMVVAIMALVALLVPARGVLAIAELVGIASLVVWQVTGDLRLYGVVQFFPGVLMLLRLRKRSALWLVLLFYAIAKACQQYDVAIYAALHVISGHTLKHLAAALATLAMWQWMRTSSSRA